ncbi:MAG: M23 family metallopeptidase [Bacteroidales bacterium]|jgi:murein DD-endopeptidase MepM/ murein hydrolase activator NlpD|nr:M23 family metallopeptidase [Bacteroidales bacterium]
MYSEEKKKRPLFFRNIRKKYSLRIQDDSTLHDKLYLKISKGRIYFFTFIAALIVSGVTFLLLAYTNLKKLIPNYYDADIAPLVYELERKADSLELQSLMLSNYVNNMRTILTGQEISDSILQASDSENSIGDRVTFENVSYSRSREDSILREEFESTTNYTLLDYSYTPATSFKNENFVAPIIGGMITNRFSNVDRHYGIDLTGKVGAPILSTLDGTVIFSEWAVETGYVLIIQHRNDLISVYKHNSTLLKKAGEYVKAGDPVAIIGNSGSLTSGMHLHFEIWYKGSPLNPEDYLIF